MKRLLALLLAMLALVSLTACSEIPDRFQDGADRFGAGKEEGNYYLPNSGALLAQLIEDFSGSLEPPFSQSMDDTGYDDAQKRAEEESGESGGFQSQVVTVANEEQLRRAFLAAYVDTAPRLQFQTAEGYQPRLDGQLLNDIYRDLQREDPIGVAGVSAWSHGNRGSDYIVEISYSFSREELNRIKAETPGLVDKAVAEMNLSTTDHYEIICAVNEYLCDTVVYPPNEPYPPLTHTPYGAFHGDGVCEGYATAAKLMLNKLGIRCDIQTGTCHGGGGHAWNLVELEGQWYQMDVTWNDGGGRRTDYLLVTDSYMKQSRSWDESDYPRSATEPYKP